ncbi:hypothetical protein BCR43DRAFT_303085 [Syncephalastrum racemosum]|uniref:Uncharacterized protein n=1 Tax=Syncephalastrum racemosum TaxID=13706 RepID=A0A1X2HA28_SYNRA|nr:hypothetical protein BCR43DRAFT_303085 [Syncephalastrum racemosum]
MHPLVFASSHLSSLFHFSSHLSHLPTIYFYFGPCHLHLPFTLCVNQFDSDHRGSFDTDKLGLVNTYHAWYFSTMYVGPDGKRGIFR